jgi:glycerol kinase
LEAIAYQTEDVICAMNADMKALSDTFGKEARIKSLKVDGGAANNSLLMQMQSNFSGIDILRPSNVEATAAGAALLAGLAVGVFASREEILKTCTEVQRFTPQMEESERKHYLHQWHCAVDACRAFTPDEG